LSGKEFSVNVEIRCLEVPKMMRHTHTYTHTTANE